MKRLSRGHRFVFHAIIEYDKEVKGYSAICLENNVASMGDTPKDAFKNLQEAVRLYISMRIKEGQYDMLVRPARKELWNKFFGRRTSSILGLLHKAIPIEKIESSLEYELALH